MFGLLKKKFKGLADKILGKSEEKIKEQEVEEEKPPISQDISKEVSKDVLKDTSSDSANLGPIKKEEETSSILKELPKDEVPKDEVPKETISKDEVPKEVISKEDVPKQTLVKEPLVKESILEEDQDIKEKPSVKKEVVSEEKVFQKSFIDPLKEDSLVSSNIGHSREEKPSLEEDQKNNEKEYSKAYQNLESKKVEDVKKGTFTKIKSLFSSKVKLSEKEISSFLEDFEISLLEADVSIDSASSIIEDLKTRLLDFSFSKSDLLGDIKLKIKETLKNQLDIDCDIENYIQKEKDEPLIVLVIGPNGAGKTTTISKFASLYKSLGKSVVFASSDTFRAGSIDQLEVHAKRLGVRVVKQTYGSDPAAVAFDAVSSAKANKADVVLIDTAGRQDTNINLMQELSKIKRVVKPHLTIYIGESQSGQTIVEQIQKFDKEIGVTGVILTKIDTDPKGGVAISILNEIKKPIFYIGTGQEYSDLEKFSPDYIIDRIV